MGWKVTANFFHPNSRFLIGHDKQNQRFSHFRMIDGTGGALINPWNRCDSCFNFRENLPAFLAFSECPFASFDP